MSIWYLSHLLQFKCWSSIKVTSWLCSYNNNYETETIKFVYSHIFSISIFFVLCNWVVLDSTFNCKNKWIISYSVQKHLAWTKNKKNTIECKKICKYKDLLKLELTAVICSDGRLLMTANCWFIRFDCSWLCRKIRSCRNLQSSSILVFSCLSS